MHKVTDEELCEALEARDLNRRLMYRLRGSNGCLACWGTGSSEIKTYFSDYERAHYIAYKRCKHCGGTGWRNGVAPE
jgi:hypothetical protein